MPFPAKTTDKSKKKIKIGIFDLHHQNLNSVSVEGIDLTKKMLKMDPKNVLKQQKCFINSSMILKISF